MAKRLNDVTLRIFIAHYKKYELNYLRVLLRNSVSESSKSSGVNESRNHKVEAVNK